MIRPTPHPKTGVFRVRLAIPAPLREAADTLYGRRSEFIENLRTKDRAEAKRLAPAAVGRLQARLEATRKAAAGAPRTPTERDVAALAGETYRALIADLGDNPAAAVGYPDAPDTAADRLEQVDDDPEAPRVLHLLLSELDAARAALDGAGLSQDAASVHRVAEAQWWAAREATGDLWRMADGHWSAPDGARYPAPRPRAEAATALARSCTFDELLRGWGLDRGWSPDTKPIKRALYDRLRTMERLAAFLGHRDASRVTKADAVRWKTEAQTRGLTAATVRNDTSEMSALWRWGLSHDMHLPHGNPFAGILPPKAKRQATRRPFTDAEAAAILKAARSCTGLLRWLPWVCCLTGARLNEIVQSAREDVATVDGYPAIRIHDDGAGRSLKNADSRRTVPLHPALIAEGFLAYVTALPPRSHLFPDVKPDAIFGSRAAPAGKRVAHWLRKTLDITDAAVSPNHSWRHWFEDAARRAGIPQEVRSTITGHSAKVDEGASYGAGLGTMTKLLADAVSRVALPAGLDQPHASKRRSESHADSPTPART